MWSAEFPIAWSQTLVFLKVLSRLGSKLRVLRPQFGDQTFIMSANSTLWALFTAHSKALLFGQSRAVGEWKAWIIDAISFLSDSHRLVFLWPCLYTFRTSSYSLPTSIQSPRRGRPPHSTVGSPFSSAQLRSILDPGTRYWFVRATLVENHR